MKEPIARNLLQAAHAAWSAGDSEGVLQCCSDDVVYWCNVEGARATLLEIRGKRALRRFLNSVAAEFESVSVPDGFRWSEGKGQARIDWYIRHRQTRLVLCGSYRQLVTFGAEQIRRVEDYHDAAQLAAFWRLARSTSQAPSAEMAPPEQDMIPSQDLCLPRAPIETYPSALPHNRQIADAQYMEMHFSEHERIALFIDGANLHAAAKTLGFEIDYKRLLGLFREKGRFVRALYYTAVAEDQEYSSVRPLVDWLDYNGFTMVTKPTKEYTDALGRRRLKGNMDIELTVDAMRLAEHIDHIVLFSGDGDFRCLVEALQHLGKRVSVISSLQTHPPMVADELRRQADQFIDLYALRDLVCREDSPRVRSSSGRV